jgi:hypothetical protein
VPTATLVATDTPTLEPILAAPPSGSPVNTPTPSATPTATPVATLTPASTATSPAAGCTGGAPVQSFIAEAASRLTFDVYCAVLPEGWTFVSGQWAYTGGGMLKLSYAGPGGARVAVSEGAFCTTSVEACSTHVADIGVGAFGDLTGELEVLTEYSSYAIYVDPGTTHAYTMTTVGMSQEDFVSYAASMLKVPKS